MKFAVIPWAERFYNNELFNAESSVNQNGLIEPYAEMKEYFEAQGHEINTIDLYQNYDDVDFFLFFDWFPLWIYKIIKSGNANKMVYCNAEPPTVRKLNRKEGYEKIKRYFPYIMTWNKELVDNKRFFFRTIPYNFVEHIDSVRYEDKKLLTSISANKKSEYIDELYTEREKLITYFENELPSQFDMYGVGWSSANHPSYKGSPQSKFDIYRKYKYALALENTKNVKGYVTEKIFDCLTGNVVPIYWGADDIYDYISPDCFIDYRKFGNPEKLKEYLLSLNKCDYERYLSAGRKAVQSPELRHSFSGKMYAENIIFLAEKSAYKTFKVDVNNLIKLWLVVVKEKAVIRIKSALKR